MMLRPGRETESDEVTASERVEIAKASPRRRRRLLAEPLPRNSMPAKAIKSARRVLEVFEFFQGVRRPATGLEIAQALDFPQSSTSALLRSLVNLGYLKQDPVERTYVSSERVALLGAWIDNELTRPGRVLELMELISERTGEAVNLMGRNGIFTQHLHTVRAKGYQTQQFATGHANVLTRTSCGYVALSRMSDEEIGRIVRRINAERPFGEEPDNPKEVMAEVEETRSGGYGLHFKKGGALASLHVLLPDHLAREFRTVGVMGDKHRIAEGAEGYARIIQEAIAAA